MTSAVAVRRPWRALPWSGWAIDVLLLVPRLVVALVGLAGRVDWTPDRIVATVVLGMPTLTGAVYSTHTAWTGLSGLGRGLVGVALLVGLVVAGPVGGRGRHAHMRVVRRGRDIEVRTGPNRASTTAARRRIAADHEAGHVAVGRARGWTVRGAEVFDDGSGVTRLRVGWLKSYDARDDIAVSLGGGKAAGTWTGCGSDFEYAHAARDSYPEDQRDAAWREGDRRADSALFWRGGQRRRDSKTMQETGSL